MTMGVRRSIGLLGIAVCASAASAQVVRQTTNLLKSITTDGAIDDAGSVVFAISDSDPYGTNPTHRLQVFKWNPATGVGSQVTSFPSGVDRDRYDSGPSVSDDGSKVVFQMGGKLAVVNADGTGFVQLISTPALIDHFQIAGNGSRVVFDSTGNLTGANPSGIIQVFAVEADGTNLRQLTTHTSHAYGVAWPTISDDGQRIAYLASQGSVDGNAQVAGILQDGTGFHYLTAASNLQPGYLQISGNGQSVAFQVAGTLTPPPGGCMGGSQVAIVDWNATGLLSLDAPCLGDAAPGSAGAPDITDDAQTIFYESHTFDGYQVRKINRNRTGQATLTDTTAQPGPPASCDAFVHVAGAGSRVAFTCHGGAPWGGSNADLSNELYAATSSGTGQLQLTDTRAGDAFAPEMTPDASRVVFASTELPSGSPPYAFPQVYTAGFDGSGVTRVTSLLGEAVSDLSVDDGGQTIVFVHSGNPTGTNTFTDAEIFAVQADGTGLRQVTPEVSNFFDSGSPRLSGNGAVIVFTSTKNFLNETGVAGTRVYRINPDGTGIGRISAKTGDSYYPRVDATGTWVVYHRSLQVHRQRVDGTSDQIVGAGAFEGRADVTSGGGLVVFESTANPLGTNPEGNLELFLWNATGGTTRQLTFTTSGANRSPSFSRDGAWVYFWSDSPRLGWEVPDALQLYRLDVATATAQRVGGLRACASGYYPGQTPLPPVAVSTAGDLAVFSTDGDCTNENVDGNSEVFAVDRLAAPQIRVTGGTGPTIVSWDVESGPSAYDVIRGDLSSLHFRGDGSVDLGTVACLENDSLDPSTANAPDFVPPSPGQSFFYLYRGVPGSYGTATSGGVRSPTSGGCP